MREIARPIDFGSPVVEVDFEEEIIWLDEEEEFILDYHFDYGNETGYIHLDVGAKDVAIGDVLILSPCERYLGGFGQKITGVYHQPDGTVIVSTVMPELEDLLAEYGSLYISGIFEGDLENFILNPNLQEDLGNEWAISEDSGGYRGFTPTSNAPFELRIDSTIGSSGRRNFGVGIIVRDGNDALDSRVAMYGPTVNASVDLRRN